MIMINADDDTVVQQDTATATMTPTLHDAHNAAALPSPDFTYRHIWGDRVGRWLLTLNHPRINSTSNVFVSISELDDIVDTTNPVPRPKPSAARMTVLSVAPVAGGVTVLIFVDSQTPVFTQLSYLVVNP
jgi:hypothetical protein